MRVARHRRGGSGTRVDAACRNFCRRIEEEPIISPQPHEAPPPPWREAVARETERVLPELVRTRRHLHHCPELSNAEFRTTEYLTEQARHWGLEPHPAAEQRGLWIDTGVWGEAGASGGDQGPLGIRGDIDALPITTRSAADYRSSVPGVMHACGHDVHATMALGAGVVLQAMAAAETLPWPVASRILLQPAEETSDGARHMIASGALQDLVAILSVHVDPTLSVGTIGLRDGVLTAGCDVFSARIEGRGGHGARPHLAADPIAAGAYWIDQAYRQVSRSIDVRTAPALSVGRFVGGDAPNAIAESVALAGTLRTTEPESREAAIELMHRVARTAESLYGVHFELHLENYTPAVINDKSLIQHLRAAAAAISGIERTVEIPLPSMGAEDFAFYLQDLPGAMFRLGTCGGPDSAHALHSSCFDIDERAIPIGIQTLVATAIEWSRPS